LPCCAQSCSCRRGCSAIAADVQLRLPLVLSANAGYVDCAGFLALQGLFTTHVTGNFVTLGAALVMGSSGTLAKLLALPVFCVAVAIVRLLGYLLANRSVAPLTLMLALELTLLMAGAALAIRWGPFASGNGWRALLTGMVLVFAMGTQNALQRLHLGNAPPTTIMTGNTTQAMIDVVDVLRRAGDQRVVRDRLFSMSVNIAAFAAGCAGAALLFVFLHMWCFALPPLLGLAALAMRADMAGTAQRPQ
jgi:uncharacterized membrane protein YoaK (UPF0700 family)